MARDPLRSTLDNLQVDPEAQADRPYLESALRRMGYSEKEIQQRLGEAPPKPGAPRPTEYRLVKPVYAARGPTLQSPFEDLQTGELAFTEEQPQEFDTIEPTNLDFEEVDPAPTYDVAFEEVAETDDEAAKREGLDWVETQEPEGTGEDASAAPTEDELSIDTFGGEGAEGATEVRTRVRVRRVRAKSRAEAEAKVAGQGRRIIKSIPVDIVERWGPGESAEKGAR